MKIVVELGRREQLDSKQLRCGKPGNSNPMIEPLEYCRRGIYVRSELEWAGMDESERRRWEGIPRELPGYHVSIDIGERKVVVYDPIGDNAELRRRVKVEEPVVLERCTDEQLWIWLSWARRYVNAGLAQLVEGRFPEIVDKRLEQERLWDTKANPHTGERPWEPFPPLDGRRAEREPAGAK